MACLYHGMHEANVHRVGLEPYDSELYLMEQFPAIFKMYFLFIYYVHSGLENF